LPFRRRFLMKGEKLTEKGRTAVTIHVKVYGTLRYYKEMVEKYISGEKVEVPEGTSAGAILEMLHLPERVATILIVNGAYTDKKKILKDGDAVYIISPVSGG